MANFTVLIRGWYRLNKRVLPWRLTNDPYKIWLSEIILQQTRVEQGLGYYQRFTEKYPRVKDLAKASEDEVLNLWQGLGYYSRARNLHFSAKFIVANYKGVFPTNYAEVLALKGVGEYTAAAICSIAYGLPYAVVDGNVYRVISRYLGLKTPIDSGKGKKEFAIAANELLDIEHPSEHNQAVMELGALVCTPKKPNCLNCPLNESCFAFSINSPLDYPVKEKKTKVVQRFFNYLILADGKRIIIKKREGNDIWKGLYDFVCIEKDQREEINAADMKMYDYSEIKEDGFYKHVLSHQILNTTFWIVKSANYQPNKGEFWVDIKELELYPMPQLLRRYIEGSSFFNVN